MNNYENIVISIIDENGIERSIESSKKDEKHVSAYKRFVSKLECDYFNIMSYINSKSSIGSLTGFDISKRISIEGNIVFFHTDVSNAFHSVKSASIIIPEKMNNIQNDKLEQLMQELTKEKFQTYLGQASRKNKRGKVKYKMLSFNRYQKERESHK